MLHKTIRDFISKNQKTPIKAPDGSIPLFVDVGVEIVHQAAFKNNITSDSVYSTLPIMACSIYYPNIIFSLVPKKELKKMKITGKIHDYTEFSFQGINKYNKDECHLFGLPDNIDSKAQILNLCSNILNPLGIGAFYSTDFDLFTTINDNPEKMLCEYLPYSMEIVRKMLFQSKTHEFSIFSVASLMILQYPLPKAFIPKPNLENLKDRFIFSKFIINNPPLLKDVPEKQIKSYMLNNANLSSISMEDIKEFSEDLDDTEPEKKTIKRAKLLDLEPYQWAYIQVLFSNVHLHPDEKIEAFIGDPKDDDFDVFDSKERFVIRKPLHKNEVFIMSPIGGELYLSGIEVGPNEDLEICVNVFLSKV